MPEIADAGNPGPVACSRLVPMPVIAAAERAPQLDAQGPVGQGDCIGSAQGIVTTSPQL